MNASNLEARAARPPSSFRAGPWPLAFAGAFIVWLPEVFLPWNWRDPGTPTAVYLGDWAVFYASYVLDGLAFLASCGAVDRWLDRPGLAPPPLREAAGALAVLASVETVYLLLYVGVLPRLLGLSMPGAALWRWGIHIAVIVLVFHGWHVASRAARRRAAALARVAVEADDLQATLARAELAILELQIEPHFLFNTLAHVRRDARHAPANAAALLDALIDYLERAGPALRRDDWTIADELDLCERYLGLVGHRFGARLRFSIDAPAPLRATRLPALAVATLVENAVRHGIAPKPEGGHLRVAVAGDAEAPGDVRITVTDDGVGLRPSQGLGLGLATVRARLRGAFGTRASLALESARGPGEAAGVRAVIRIAAHV